MSGTPIERCGQSAAQSACGALLVTLALLACPGRAIGQDGFATPETGISVPITPVPLKIAILSDLRVRDGTMTLEDLEDDETCPRRIAVEKDGRTISKVVFSDPQGVPLSIWYRR